MPPLDDPDTAHPEDGEQSSVPFEDADPRVLAGFDVWKTTQIDREGISWLPEARARQQRNSDEARARDELAAKRLHNRRVAAVVWLISAVVLAIVSVFGEAIWFGLGNLLLGLAVGTPRLFTKRIDPGGETRRVVVASLYILAWFVVVIISVMAYVLFPVHVAPGASTYTALIVGASVVVTVVSPVSYGVAVYWRREPYSYDPYPNIGNLATFAVTDSEVARRFSWGAPGRNLNVSSSPRFSKRNKELGFGGELLTSQLLDIFAEIPGVKVVHSIQPSRREADIDHVVLCGDLVFLVDSKNWTGGDYYWLSGQIMCSREDGSLERRGDPMGWVLPEMMRDFAHKRVIPLIVIHSNDGVPVRTNNRDASAGAFLMNPHDFIESVGRWCLDQDARSVDRATLSRLVCMQA